jgi:hypothetical protein
MATFAGPGWAIHPNDEAGMLGVGAIAAASDRGAIRPDDRGTARGPGSLSIGVQTGTAVSPDDRGGAKGPGAVSSSSPVTLSAPAADGDGFPWTTASTGALLLALAGLLGTAFLVSGRHHRAA